MDETYTLYEELDLRYMGEYLVLYEGLLFIVRIIGVLCYKGYYSVLLTFFY